MFQTKIRSRAPPFYMRYQLTFVMMLTLPHNCTARQCSPLKRKFMECSIINPALSFLMKHLVIGQRQKAPYFSAFHWSLHGSLVSIGQHFVTTRIVHLPKRTETSLITESDQSGPNQQLLQLCRPCVKTCLLWLYQVKSLRFSLNFR